MRAGNWVVAIDAWNKFVLDDHPEVVLERGRQAFHNFLRFHRPALLNAGVILKVSNRHWIADPQRFSDAAFDCLTRKTPQQQ